MCEIVSLDARRKAPRKKVQFEIAMERAAKQAYIVGVIRAVEEHRPAMLFNGWDREDLS